MEQQQQKQPQRSRVASAVMTELQSASCVGCELDDDPMCCICHNTGGRRREALVRACWCKGSVGSVHKSCLETWLLFTRKHSCPICNFRFHLHYSMKPLSQWVWPRPDTSDRLMLGFAVVSYLVLVLQLAALSLLIVYYPTCSTSASIGIASVVLGLPWLVTCCIGMAGELHHSEYWVNWRKRNRRVVVDLVDPDQVATAV